jgi:hypothetical protein
MIEGIKEQATHNLETSGSVMPVLFTNKRHEGKWIIAFYGMPEFGKPKMKDLVMARIQATIQKNDLREFILLSEAWMADPKDAMPQYQQGKSLGHLDSSKRKEAVVIYYCSPSKEIHWIGLMDRSGEKPTVKEWESFDSEASDVVFHETFNTRFGSVWTRAKARQGSN